MPSQPHDASGASSQSSQSGDSFIPGLPNCEGAPPHLPTDIADELADHLACRAEELAAGGVAPSDAVARARRDFGDVNAVNRELIWINEGDRIMSQRLIVAAMAALMIGMVGLGYLQYRSAATTNAALTAMSEAVGASLRNEAEAIIRVVDEQGRPRPGQALVIKGVQASPELSNATFVRSYVSDADGVVRSGSLVRGSYLATASIPRPDDSPESWSCRSEVNFSIFQIEAPPSLHMVVPTLRTLVRRFEPPELPEGWTAAERLKLHFRESTGGPTRVRGSVEVGFLSDAQFALPAETELTAAFGVTGPKALGNQWYDRKLEEAALLGSNSATWRLIADPQWLKSMRAVAATARGAVTAPSRAEP